MKAKILRGLAGLLLSLPLAAAPVDLTQKIWAFETDAVPGDWSDSWLLFETMTPNGDNFDLTGGLIWRLDGARQVENRFIGRVYDDNTIRLVDIAQVDEEPGALPELFLFDGLVNFSQDRMVGTFAGLFDLGISGNWMATETNGPSPRLTVIALPTSAVLFMSAVGFAGLITVRRKR